MPPHTATATAGAPAAAAARGARDGFLELFVPGRLCLVGEHSDWAGAHRASNGGIRPGRTLVAGTQQGLHARARRIERPVVRCACVRACVRTPAGRRALPAAAGCPPPSRPDGGRTARNHNHDATMPRRHRWSHRSQTQTQSSCQATRRSWDSSPDARPLWVPSPSLSRAPASLARRLRSVREDGSEEGPFEIPLRADALLEAARAGGFWSYGCGVAYRMLTNFRVGGLEVDNFLTTLPLRKGLR